MAIAENNQNQLNQQGPPRERGTRQPVVETQAFRDRLKRLAGLLTDLICPPECLWCESLLDDSRNPQTDSFCQECLNGLTSQYYRCQTCASPLPTILPNADCHRCRKERWRFDQVLTLGPYRDELSQLIVKLKKPHQDILRRAIGRLMAREFCSHFESPSPEPILVLPVPNHWTHAFSGAANTAGQLADTIAEELGVTRASRMVRRTRKTAKQGMLSWTERRENVRGAFQIVDAKPLNKSHVILVDDVLTSGATAGEIASQLKRGGTQRVTVLVAARGVGSKETVLDESKTEIRDGN